MSERFVVLTVDQRGSRTGTDLVPDALAALADVATRVPFERTVGDELQGVLDQPEALVDAVGVLLSTDAWHIGIGFGSVEEPLAETTRAGSGAAFIHARTAVARAKSSPWHTAVVAPATPTPGTARHLETVLWLWAAVFGRRTTRGWEVADLVAEGLRYDEVAQRLGISPSAVSQRAAAAGIVEARRARELATDLTRHLLGKDPS